MTGFDFFEFATMIFVICAIFGFLLSVLGNYTNQTQKDREKEEIKRAGNRGESIATSRLESVMEDGDQLYTNVPLEFEGHQTELDNVVVNENGVFIVEVKNYSGRLVGTEDMPTWTKYHTSAGGETYTKTVKNPIGQVKRQTYILSRMLRHNNIRARVDGFAYLVEENSPVKSERILADTMEMHEAFHRPGKRRVSAADRKKIEALFSEHLAAA